MQRPEQARLADHQGPDHPEPDRRAGLLQEALAVRHGQQAVGGEQVGQLGRPDVLVGLGPVAALPGGRAVAPVGRACGIGEAALRRAVAYAGEREVFGRPIGANQAIAHPLARAHMQLAAAKAVMRDAAWRYDHDLPCGEQANTAKYLAAEASWFAADQAVQTHGGLGYATEYHVERYWRDARLTKIFEGTSEIQQRIISDHLLGKPKAA